MLPAVNQMRTAVLRCMHFFSLFLSVSFALHALCSSAGHALSFGLWHCNTLVVMSQIYVSILFEYRYVTYSKSSVALTLCSLHLLLAQILLPRARIRSRGAKFDAVQHRLRRPEH